MSRKPLDLAGRTFGHLTVQERVQPDSPSPHAYWRCLCSCGQVHVVRGSHLAAGNTTQCPRCVRDRVAAVAAREQPVTVVELWCTGAGEHGGFARAVDSAGTVLARSHFSRLPQKLAGRHHNIKLVRLVLATLEGLGQLRPRNTGESHGHWWKACSIRCELRMFTPAEVLQERWFETAHAPGPECVQLRSGAA